MKKYDKVIEEIHSQFDNATIRLSSEFDEILKRVSESNSDKVEALRILGFINSSPVTDHMKLMDDERKFKEYTDYAKEYSMKYTQKFICEWQVEEICKKYGLVIGEAYRFKGFIPEKNVCDMLKFKLKTEDVLYQYGLESSHNGIKYIKHKVLWDAEKHFSNITTYNHTGLQTISVVGTKVGLHNDHVEYFRRVGFSICAPLSEMDMTNATVTDGYKIQSTIKDPIVLQKVLGGYLVITAWGDEASDPNVINANNN